MVWDIVKNTSHSKIKQQKHIFKVCVCRFHRSDKHWTLPVTGGFLKVRTNKNWCCNHNKAATVATWSHTQIASMYGRFTYIWVFYGANVSIYTIHWAFGIMKGAYWVIWGTWTCVLFWGGKLIKGMLYLNLNHWKHGVARGGKLIKGMLSGRVAKHGLPRGCEKFESMGCQGGGKFDKRNVARWGRKAWVAKGGGEKLIEGMLYLNLNDLETVQKPVGFFTLKSGRVAADPW